MHRVVDEFKRDGKYRLIFDEILGLTARTGGLEMVTSEKWPPGCTALHLACKGRFSHKASGAHAVSELLRHGANTVALDPRGATPLMMAITSAAEPQSEVLLAQSTEAEINLRNCDRPTAHDTRPA